MPVRGLPFCFVFAGVFAGLSLTCVSLGELTLFVTERVAGRGASAGGLFFASFLLRADMGDWGRGDGELGLVCATLYKVRCG